MKKRPFTTTEEDYIRRVARQVPVVIMAEHLECDAKKIRDFCTARHISTRVPDSVLRKHYPDVWKMNHPARRQPDGVKKMAADSLPPRKPEVTKKSGWCCNDFGVSSWLTEIGLRLKSVRSA